MPSSDGDSSRSGRFDLIAAVILLLTVLSSCGDFGEQTNCVATQIEATDATAVGTGQDLTLRAVFRSDDGEPLADFEIEFWLINENSEPTGERLWAGATTDANGVAEADAMNIITGHPLALERADSATGYRAEYPSFGIVQADGKVYCEAKDEAEFSFTPGP